MGSFTTRLGVSDGNGGAAEWVVAQVDTGAVHTVLPASLLHLLGVTPDEEREFVLGDRSVRTFPVGEARIHVEGREAYSRVVFGVDGKYLLGATTLQMLDLIPDTTNEKLIPAPELTI